MILLRLTLFKVKLTKHQLYLFTTKLILALCLVLLLGSCGETNRRKQENKDLLQESLTQLLVSTKVGVESQALDSLSWEVDSCLVTCDEVFVRGVRTEFSMHVESRSLDQSPFVFTRVNKALSAAYEVDSCARDFCSWYLKSARGKDLEILLTEETEARGMPYIAVQITEQDGISD